MQPPDSAPVPVRDADDLVRETLPLVGHIVRDVAARVPTHVDREDLMSAGLLALAQAARAYDPGRGVRFASYAATRVRGALLDELRGLDWASRSVRRRARQVDEARSALAVTLGRPATDAEVADFLGLGAAELAAHHDDVARASVASLDSLGGAVADELLPTTGETPLDALVDRERVAYLRDAVDELPDRLRAVVRGYYFAERPMAEIAAELGVTDSRVSQLRAEAVALLRGALAASLDAETGARSAGARPADVGSCATRRKQTYYAQVARRRSFAARLSEPALTA
ncbi:MAG TPA: sigma-70 family RNA polymerase sigma factor [Pedococcus sp.]